MVTERPKSGQTVKIAMGLAYVVSGDAHEGRARGIRVLREHSGNFYLDAEGRPRESPSRYSEFIQDGFWQVVPD